MDAISIWDRKYSRRQRKGVYDVEHIKLNTPVWDIQALVQLFLEAQSSDLDPPADLRFYALKDFMGRACLQDIDSRNIPAVLPEDIVLLDDRQDNNTGHNSTRIWDSEGDNGYMNRPPPGNVIHSGPFSIPEFVRVMERKVGCVCQLNPKWPATDYVAFALQRLEIGAERRNM